MPNILFFNFVLLFLSCIKICLLINIILILGIPINDIGVHSFSVDYLGSVPLQEKVTSLAGLQSPLRDLYFAYKKMTSSRKVYTGRLEISHQGLKVLYQGEKGK